jgi:hypothetical protein
MTDSKPLPKPCRFHIYGCNYRLPPGHTHEDVCHYRPRYIESDPLWRELVHRVDRQHSIDIIRALGPWAREIRPVSFMQSDSPPIQDVPYYLDVSSWWSKGIPDVEAVQQGLLPALRRALGVQNAQLLVNQMGLQSTHTPEQVVRYLNLKSPRRMLQKFGFDIPAWIAVQIDECLWNATPRFSFTDLHTDRGLDTIAFQVGGRKIWLLYEPDPPVTAQNKVLERQSAYFEAWAKRFQEATTGSENSPTTFLEQTGPTMRRPYIAVTEAYQALFIPAGWKHAVFTLQSGYLGGFSFCTHQHLDQHVNTLLCELHAAMRLVNPEKYTARTDHLLPELWADLSGSLGYVMVHIHEVLLLPGSSIGTQAADLWRRLHCFLKSFAPALMAKHARMVNKCNKILHRDA